MKASSFGLSCAVINREARLTASHFNTFTSEICSKDRHKQFKLMSSIHFAQLIFLLRKTQVMHTLICNFQQTENMNEPESKQRRKIVPSSQLAKWCCDHVKNYKKSRARHASLSNLKITNWGVTQPAELCPELTASSSLSHVTRFLSCFVNQNKMYKQHVSLWFSKRWLTHILRSWDCR